MCVCLYATSPGKLGTRRRWRDSHVSCGSPRGQRCSPLTGWPLACARVSSLEKEERASELEQHSEQSLRPSNQTAPFAYLFFFFLSFFLSPISGLLGLGSRSVALMEATPGAIMEQDRRARLSRYGNTRTLRTNAHIETRARSLCGAAPGGDCCRR